MEKYEVPRSMTAYFGKVLERDGIAYKGSEVNGKAFICASVGKESFEILLEDAECEKQRANTNPEIPVYSYRTLTNVKKRMHLMALTGKRMFHVLKRDEGKFLADFGEEDYITDEFVPVLQYKEYIGTVEYSRPDGCYYGKILETMDMILYEGNTLEELEDDFCEVVDSYIELLSEIKG